MVSELLGLKLWYLPDGLKIWDRRFGTLFKSKYFCYDDDEMTWLAILERYFIELDYLPKRAAYASARSYNGAWGYFAELLAVVQANQHKDFESYYHLALQKGMSKAVFERKVRDLEKIKSLFMD